MMNRFPELMKVRSPVMMMARFQGLMEVRLPGSMKAWFPELMKGRIPELMAASLPKLVSACFPLLLTVPALLRKDAGNTWYTGYLAAAKRLGISAGVGNNMFVPEQAITRQEMFTLLYNALKVIEQLPEEKTGKTLSYFTDADEIAPWAEEAIKYLVEAGIINGDGGSRLLSKDTATRAQMAQMLFNLLTKHED